MHQCISNQSDFAFGQNRGYPNRAVMRTHVINMADQFQDMSRFARHPRDQTITMPMRKHQRSKNVTIPSRKTMHVGFIKTFALQALVEIIFVIFQMFCVRSIHHFQLTGGITKSRGLQPLMHVTFSTYDNGFSKSLALIQYSGAQDPLVIPFGKDNPSLRRTCTRIDPPQNTRCGVHAGFQRQLIAVHIHNWPAGRASVHSSACNRGRYAVDQTRIKGRWDDIIAAKAQLRAIGQSHLIGHLFTGQVRERARAGYLHLIIDRSSVNIQRAAEQIGETQNIIDLIGIIRPPSCHNRIWTHRMCLFRRNFRIRVGHGKNHRIRGHTFHHCRRNCSLNGNTQEHICAHHCIIQTAQLC